MVKTPRTRHSKTQREPVTIDLEADKVKRDTADKTASAPATSSEAPRAAAAGPATAAAGETKSDKTDAPQAKPDAAAGKAQAMPSGFGRSSSSEQNTQPEAPKVEAPKSTGPQPASRGGAGGTLGAGLAGGVVALALAAGLQWAGVLPGLKPEARTADPAMETLRQQVAALEAKLEEQQGRIAAGGGEDVNAALTQATELASSLDGRISELGTQLSTLQRAVSSGAAGEGAGVEALAARVAQLEEGGQGGETDGALNDAVQDVSRQVAELQVGTAKISADTAAAMQRASDNAAALSNLTSAVEALKSQVAENNDAPRMALVIAASALKSAVERGTPFASELDTYAAIAPEAAALAPLRDYAAKGVPSRTTLAAEVPEVATRIVAAANRAEGGNGGIIDNLMSSARSLVVVRPVGSVEGEGVDAIAARMEAAVLANDYEKALAEYAALPEAGKQAAADFAGKLEARQAADQALEKALSDALKGA
ncbi:COG4223 family protein [Nitratireductor soli]|uniref:COG4223 family protein n=1 Tax=Nitratireductor soli TaxID=1670619 RepID=UPI00065E1433|nr:hypothetical protein [Nitratireductor soli]